MTFSSIMTRRLVPLLLAVSLPTFAEPSTGIHFELISDSYSEGVALHQLINDLEGEAPSSGEVAFTHNQIELGWQQGQWSLGWLARYDYFIEFNGDTLELAYLGENDLPIPERQYQVRLQANHLRAQGLWLAQSFRWRDRLQGEWRLNVLKADQNIDGALEGSVQAEASVYDAELYLDYAYTEDKLLRRPEDAADGEGYAIDVSLHWRFNEDFSLSFTAQDLFSEIRWSDASYTQARVNTNNVSYDADGQIDARPLVSGIESFRQESQRLPKRVSLSLQQRINADWGVQYEWYRYDEYDFPRTRLVRHWGDKRLSVEYDWRAQSVGLNWRDRHWQLGFTSDDSNIKKASRVALQAGLFWPL